MPRFFADNIAEDYAVIEGEDAIHISRSLRMQQGDEITLSDQKGFDYHTAISSIEADRVVLKVIEKTPNLTEPKVKTTLYQAMPKGDKMELIIQKSVELGVHKIVPILTSRCISRPKDKAMDRKIDRYQKIALEAAKQSQRGIIPEIGRLLSFEEALEEMTDYPVGVLLYENASEPLSNILTPLPDRLAVMVGSEGGFAPEEAQKAEERGIKPLSLGRRILRTETAPLCFLSALSYASGEF